MTETAPQPEDVDVATAEEQAQAAEHELAQLEETARDGANVTPDKLGKAETKARGFRRLAELARDRAARRAEQARQQEANEKVDQLVTNLRAALDNDREIAEKAARAGALMAEVHQAAQEREKVFRSCAQQASSLVNNDHDTPAADRVDITRTGLDRMINAITVDDTRYSTVASRTPVFACLDAAAIDDVMNNPGGTWYMGELIANARKAMGIDG